MGSALDNFWDHKQQGARPTSLHSLCLLR